MHALPVCRWRADAGPARHLCRSPRFVDAPNLVGEEFCRRCGYADQEAPPPPRALPCVHLGGTPAGGAADPRPGSFGCTVHGACAPDGPADAPPGVRRCAGCADYLAGDPFGPNSADMRRRADAFLDAVPAYPEGRYRGRGVVLAGGGERFFAALYVTVRALRHVGCRLPAQVWYLGRHDEMPADRRALLAPYGVDFVDADEVRRTHPARGLDGWELKVFAALHSPFEELLFLDADCYPCRDPEFLFDLADYRARGAIFWPDTMPHDHRLKWAAYGVADPKRPGSAESGQFVLDKRRCWRALNLAWFYNDHSDYYYRYGYGDKHTFEVAWARCGPPFVMWRPQAVWERVAYVHPGPDGVPLFVHRCADKFRFGRHTYVTRQNTPGGAFCAELPLERECWDWMAELAGLLGDGPDRIAEEERGRTAPVPLA